MKKRILNPFLMLFLLSFLIVLSGCSKKDESKPTPNYIWDIEKSGIPKFVSTNYIDLDNIYRISKFRSSVGHDYSDFTEHCRSMKHYFEPKNNADWTTIKIYSPVTGIITRVEEEWAGTKIEIESEEYPAFRFSVFHINLTSPRKVDDKIVAGEQLGTHIGSQTMSDISVIVNDSTRQGRMVSYFEVITDEVFSLYSNRGVSKREDLIISRDVRDADPLTCDGDTFMSEGSVENWFTLY
jgi:hypothetical protein